jgi:hypothetical protein
LFILIENDRSFNDLVDQINKQTNGETGQLFESVKEKEEAFFSSLFSDMYRIQQQEEKEIENRRNTTSIMIVCSARREKENEKYCLNIIVLSCMCTVYVESGRRKRRENGEKKK